MLNHKVKRQKEKKKERVQYIINSDGSFEEKKGKVRTLAEVNGLTKDNRKRKNYRK